MTSVFAALIIFLTDSLSKIIQAAAPLPRSSPWSFLSEIPHDQNCFTQGLTFYNKTLVLESCGLYKNSKLKQLEVTWDKTNVVSLTPKHVYKFDGELFAEGLAVRDKLVYVLTWKEKKILVFDVETLRLIRRIDYSKEGWGLTYDTTKKIFYATDGSDQVYHLNITENGVEILKSVSVTYKDRAITPSEVTPVRNLNELEFYNGKLYANVWYTPFIYRLDPETGICDERYDMSSTTDDEADVLNGIAYVPGSDNMFWSTGKLWSKINVVQLGKSL